MSHETVGAKINSEKNIVIPAEPVLNYGSYNIVLVLLQ